MNTLYSRRRPGGCASSQSTSRVINDPWPRGCVEGAILAPASAVVNARGRVLYSPPVSAPHPGRVARRHGRDDARRSQDCARRGPRPHRCPGSGGGTGRCADPRHRRVDLWHRRPHLQLGRLERRAHQAATRARPRVRRGGGRRGRECPRPATGHAGARPRATSSSPARATSGRAPSTSPTISRSSASTGPGRSPSTCRCRGRRSGVNAPTLAPEIASLQDPFGNAVHTVHAQEVAGARVLDHRRRPHRAHGHPRGQGRRRRGGVRDRCQPKRLAFAERLGADLALDATADPVAA